MHYQKLYKRWTLKDTSFYKLIIQQSLYQAIKYLSKISTNTKSIRYEFIQVENFFIYLYFHKKLEYVNERSALNKIAIFDICMVSIILGEARIFLSRLPYFVRAYTPVFFFLYFYLWFFKKKDHRICNNASFQWYMQGQITTYPIFDNHWVWKKCWCDE